MQRLISLKKNGEETFIDVVVPNSISPILAVTQFWSTHVMNYITADGVCVMYPTLTFKKIGVINPTSAPPDGTLDLRLTALVQKYTQRGFNIHTVSTLPVTDAIPSLTLYHPLEGPAKASRWREDGDQDCLLVRWGPGCARTRIGIRVAVPNLPRIWWRLKRPRRSYGEALLIDQEGAVLEHWK